METDTNTDTKAEQRRLKKREWNRRHYLKNQQWFIDYRAENKESRDAYSKAYAKKNPGVFVLAVQKRRAAKYRAIPAWHGELDALAEIEAEDLSRLREKATGFAWQIDHMIPLRCKYACGLHIGINLQVIPKTMNSRKLARLVLTRPGEWIRSA